MRGGSRGEEERRRGGKEERRRGVLFSRFLVDRAERKTNPGFFICSTLLERDRSHTGPCLVTSLWPTSPLKHTPPHLLPLFLSAVFLPGHSSLCLKPICSMFAFTLSLARFRSLSPSLSFSLSPPTLSTLCVSVCVGMYVCYCMCVCTSVCIHLTVGINICYCMCVCVHVTVSVVMHVTVCV